MKCIVIDDEPMAVEILQTYCGKAPFLELAGCFTDALAALTFLQDAEVDLIFLDINMPDLSGIQLVRALEHKPMVIFTTAYPQHAVTGFELDAVDYLLKPIAFDRFLKAINKARQRIKPRPGPAAAGPSSPAEPEDGFVFVKSGYKHLKLNVDEILYLESDKNYVNLMMADRKVMALLSMDQALAMLPPGRFMRIHKSYIVALGHITVVEKHSVFIGKVELPIGDSFRKALFEKIAGGKPT